MHYILKESHLHTIFEYFKASLRSSLPTKNWLQAKGIDYKKIEIGLDSGKHHRGKDEQYIKECLSNGTLSANPGGGYRSCAKDCLVFALKNQEGQIVNFFAQSLEPNQFGFYIKENLGLFPHFPSLDASEIILTENILDAAKLQKASNNIILALDNGNLSIRHKEALLQLTELKKVLFAPYFNPSLRNSIESFLNEHIGELEYEECQETRAITEQSIVTTSNESSIFHNQDPEYLQFEYKNIHIDVMGGVSNGLDQLKVTLKISLNNYSSKSYRDIVNLYQRVQLSNFTKEASASLHIEVEKLEQAICLLIAELEKYRLERKDTDISLPISRNALPYERKQKALSYLSEKKLGERLRGDLQRIGITGEVDNLEILFYAMTSRLLTHPLSVVIHAKSGSGKSILMEAVADCMPKTEYVEITSVSQKSFYHWNEHFLSHKILLIQDWFAIDPEIEYIIREIQTKHKVSRPIAVRDKNNSMVTIVKEVFGPVSVISATTANKIFEENANRSIPIYLNEDKSQDKKIVERQLQLSARAVNIYEERLIKQKLQDGGCVLKSFSIKNPYAPFLKLPESVQDIRRMNQIYIHLIEAITLYHQYQRKTEVDKQTGEELLISQIEDIEIANRLMPPILVSRIDLLSKANRNFYESLKEWKKQNSIDVFGQKEICRGLRMGVTKVKRSIKSLHDYGYLNIVGGDRYKEAYQYRLTDTGEYEQIKLSVAEALENSLKEIKFKYG
jgi:DNA primase